MERNKKKYDSELSELRKENGYVIEDLKNQLATLENELVRVESYKREKENHDKKLASLEATVREHNSQLFDALEAQERSSLVHYPSSTFYPCYAIFTGNF